MLSVAPQFSSTAADGAKLLPPTFIFISLTQALTGHVEHVAPVRSHLYSIAENDLFYYKIESRYFLTDGQMLHSTVSPQPAHRWGRRS